MNHSLNYDKKFIHLLSLRMFSKVKGTNFADTKVVGFYIDEVIAIFCSKL